MPERELLRWYYYILCGAKGHGCTAKSVRSPIEILEMPDGAKPQHTFVTAATVASHHPALVLLISININMTDDVRIILLSLDCYLILFSRF